MAANSARVMVLSGRNNTADRSGDTQMASEQGFYAIAAALRSVRGESSLYRMTDAVPAAQPDKVPAAPA